MTQQRGYHCWVGQCRTVGLDCVTAYRLELRAHLHTQSRPNRPVAQRAASGTELRAAEYVQQYLAQRALDGVGPLRARALRRVGASVRVRTDGVRTRLLQRRLSPRHAAAQMEARVSAAEGAA